MKTPEKYVAQSIDQKNWYAAIWVEYVKEYVEIQSSPCFKNPKDAIIWAKKVGF